MHTLGGINSSGLSDGEIECLVALALVEQAVASIADNAASYP